MPVLEYFPFLEMKSLLGAPGGLTVCILGMVLLAQGRSEKKNREVIDRLSKNMADQTVAMTLTTEVLRNLTADLQEIKHIVSPPKRKLH